jgi:ArsR family transcriptional regulator
LIGINITIQQSSALDCCPPISDHVLGTADAALFAAAFGALSDPVRLKLFSILAASPDAEVCACNLVKPVGRSQPTVSHHLKVLREAGLILSTKRGTWVWYRVNHERLGEIREVLR